MATEEAKPEEMAPVVAKYLVDNTLLRASSQGMQYRASKNLDDRAEAAANWGDIVSGADAGYGWLIVLGFGGMVFLPFEFDKTPFCASCETGEECCTGQGTSGQKDL